VAFVIVAITLLIVVFLLEKEGRSSTGIFDSYFAAQEARIVVARVNGNEIRNSDLTTSIEQFNQAAVAQGVDISNPDIKSEIKSQALEVLVNTQLLKAEAIKRGIEVTPEQAAERLATIETEIGGADVLTERMEALGLNRERLQSDIRDEIMIQSLLDQVFAEAQITITDEEVQSVYEAAGGAAAGLPELAEVRPEVEAQIKSSKEQAAIDAFLSSLRGGANVEIL
jgi:FKBP-type peptidyl-prolyl cis-trans isomerase (trigger factor)